MVTELASETAFDNLATDGTADGAYCFPDSGEEYLDASMVGYDGGTVEGALDYTVKANFTKAVVFATSAVGGKYYAVLGNLPIVYPTMPTLTLVNVLGVGDAPLTDFTVGAIDYDGNYYMYSTNSAYVGKAVLLTLTV